MSYSPRFYLAFIAFLFFVGVNSGASAGPTWAAYNAQVAPGNEAAVVEAVNTLMASDVGKSLPGRVVLLDAAFNGPNPTTHTLVFVGKSSAELNAWGQSLGESEAGQAFFAALGPNLSPVSESLSAHVKSYGNVDESNSYWLGYAIDVSDAGGFVAALDKLWGSATGKKHPGEAHLLQLRSGDASVTHFVAVGFENAAEEETWRESLAGNADMEAFQKESTSVANLVSRNIDATVAQWGNFSLKETLGIE